MIYIKSPEYYSSCIKKERTEMFKYLVKQLLMKGPKLTPIPYEAIKHFDCVDIYKVSGMETEFKKTLDNISNNIEYFATSFHTCTGVKRIRKFAVIKIEDYNYIVFQQTLEFALVILVLDVKRKKKYRVHSTRQAKALIDILHAPIEKIPIVINDKHIMKNKTIKKIVLNKIGY